MRILQRLALKSNSGFNEINKKDLPAVYSTVFRCLLVVLLFFWIYCITAATPLIRGYVCNKAKKKTVKRQADTKTRWNSSQLSLFHGVTNGLCEHSRACRALLFFFASRSRNKKFALRACEQRKNLESTSKRALV